MTIIPGNKDENEKSTVRYDLTTPYCLTRFGVYSKYWIYDRGEGTKITLAVDSRQEDIDISTSYNPLDFQLDIEIAKINSADYNSILLFCSKFGIPVDSDYNNIDGAYHTFELECFGGNRTIHSVELDFLIEEINAIRSGVKAWHTVKNGSYNDITNLALQFKEESHNWLKRWDCYNDDIKNTLHRVYSRKSNTSNFNPYLLYQSVMNEDVNHQLMAYLFLLTALGMRGIYWRTQFIKGTIVPAVYFKTPLDVAWFQLSRSITQNISYRKCENPKCNNIFAVTNEKQRFCPPAIQGKRSSCENAYNQSKFRERRKKGVD